MASVQKKKKIRLDWKNEGLVKSLQFCGYVGYVPELLQHSELGKKRYVDETSCFFASFSFFEVPLRKFAAYCIVV
jgi:hypothetical protein